MVLHRDELRDVCRQLDELSIPYDERSNAPRSAADGGPWSLVVATPQRVLELAAASGVADRATHMAVCEGFSRTLAAKLGQARVDFVLRRPVHPGALRLLLLHAWYRGPEKRRFRRVSIGAPVRVRIGWRQRPGMLLELSTTGCRIQIDRMLARESRLAVQLPAELTGGRSVKLKGHVVRTMAAAADDPVNGHEVAVQFETLPTSAFTTVSNLVREYGKGPAEWRDAPKAMRDADAPHGETDPANEAPWTPNRRDPEVPDRRSSPRLRYAKPVLVKGDGASRILMGQDLSIGGMRVNRDPGLGVGDSLRIALYGEDGIPPLMLQTTVAREDGPYLVLTFDDPGEAAQEQLRQIMKSAPVTAGGEGDGEGTALVVSEIVEQG
ncbi:MAG: PilZ domain-containing protein [Myxococcales bacterium]|nr:PilZ domain-containing protein [Myxococcales bacterium]